MRIVTPRFRRGRVESCPTAARGRIARILNSLKIHEADVDSVDSATANFKEGRGKFLLPGRGQPRSSHSARGSRAHISL